LLLDVVEDIKDARKLQQLIQTKEVQEAFDTLDLSALTEEQIKRMMFEEYIATDYQEVYEEKLKELAAQKAQETAYAIARHLLSDQIDMAIIQRSTGLTRQEILTLQQDDTT